MKILVVDDEPAYRQMLETFLKTEDWAVYTAANGEEALKRLAEVEIDFIISDIYMPIMDGLKLHAKVKEIPQYKTTPFLFISGYSDEHTLNAVTRSKNDGFIQKTQLLVLLKDWIRYLMTPEERRPSTPPGGKPALTQYERTRDPSYHKRR